MRIEAIQVEAFTVFDAPTLDPVTVVLHDLGGGKGRLLIECYCDAWAGYWGAMGEPLVNFLTSCSADYIANRVHPGGLSRKTQRYEYLKRIVVAVQAALKERSSPETGALCPHGMPLAENVCGPCSQGRPNTMSVNEAEPARPCYASGVAGICRLPAGHDGTHAFS